MVLLAAEEAIWLQQSKVTFVGGVGGSTPRRHLTTTASSGSSPGGKDGPEVRLRDSILPGIKAQSPL